MIDNLVITNSCLGRGEFGKVVVAHSRDFSEYYAVKIINNYGPELINEVTILMKFKHPNLVRLNDLKVDTQKKKTYIAMDLCNGGTLQEFLNERGRFTESEARFIMH